MNDATNYYRTLEISRVNHPEGGEKFQLHKNDIEKNRKMTEEEKIEETRNKLIEQGKARRVLEKIKNLVPRGSAMMKDLEDYSRVLDQDQKSVINILRENGVDAGEIERLNSEAKGMEYRHRRTDNIKMQEHQVSLKQLVALEKQLGMKLPETRKRIEEQKEELERRRGLEKSNEIGGKETGPAERGKSEIDIRPVK